MKIKHLSALLVSGLLLLACSTPQIPVAGTPQMDAQAKTFAVHPARARIYVYRNLSSLSEELRVNGVAVGTLMGRSYLPLEVSPGTYRLQAKRERETILELNVLAGRNYFVLLEAIESPMNYRSSLREVSEAEAREAIKSSQLLLSSVYPLSP
ncbi:DUF2846 domain-containing protein [Uliginosibacterium aquaticum]|uniref:DUF2846 domain-containing protein n=1 Tax=Uliginosibacterium aquaticum TaxID=2731212 RepID=A0ABX2IHG3_9RHOO|nr:DUF2846 domain-containing protein [Uliginosibacterium aquaticum]NSL56254.1 DUF2846 domain-containing protein [Uliginosibacterium aquaticum]